MQINKIKLEVSWEACRDYGSGWECSSVDLKIGQLKYDVWAHINDNIPEGQKQPLKLIYREKSDSRGFYHSFLNQEKTCDILELPLNEVKKMSISVRITKTYYEYGEMRARGDYASVTLKETEFEDGATYTLRFTSKEIEGYKGVTHKKLYAAFEKKAEQVFQAKINENQNKPVNNEDLDSLSIEELKQRLESASNELKKLGEVFNQINDVKYKSPNKISEWLKAYRDVESAAVKVVQLEEAINKK